MKRLSPTAPAIGRHTATTTTTAIGRHTTTPTAPAISRHTIIDIVQELAEAIVHGVLPLS
jgi:hypothetical protein